MPASFLTKRAAITDASIKRYGADKEIRQLSEPGTAIVFRYSEKDRAKGSFHLRHYQNGLERWKLIARYPDVSTKQVRAIYRDMKATLYTDPKTPAPIDRFDTVQDLMEWHLNRVKRDPDLSATRKASVTTQTKAINAHLGSVSLSKLTRHTVDEELIQPARDRYATSYVRALLGTLRRAAKQAYALHLLTSDPLAGYTFKDFVNQNLGPAAPKMNQNNLKPLIDSLPESGRGHLLVQLMLMWGTRIQETTEIRWAWIDTPAMMLRIPASHTKGEAGQNDIPLTYQAMKVLRRHRNSQRAGTAFIFPGAPKKPMDVSLAHKEIKAISNGDWTSHELRKLARTVWGDLGVEWMVAERMLNHTVKGLDKIYNASQLEEQKRRAMEVYHTHLESLGLFDCKSETVTRSGI